MTAGSAAPVFDSDNAVMFTVCRAVPLVVPLLLVLGGISTAGAEVYRCVERGTPRFSDQPCAAGTAPLAVPPPNVIEAGPQAPLAERYQQRVETYQRERAVEDADWRRQHEQRATTGERVREARQRGEVVVGMSVLEVRGLRGDPQQIQPLTANGIRREVWTYGGKNKPRETVTFENGVVVKHSGGRAKPR